MKNAVAMKSKILLVMAVIAIIVAWNLYNAVWGFNDRGQE